MDIKYVKSCTERSDKCLRRGTGAFLDKMLRKFGKGTSFPQLKNKLHSTCPCKTDMLAGTCTALHKER